MEHGNRLIEAEKFIESQKYKNNIIKPFISAEQVFSSIRKLPLSGSPADGTSLFEWPKKSDLRMMTLEELANSKLSKIEYYVGGSVWSVRITMSDGR